MSGEKFDATASIDKATSGDGVHSLVLRIELSDGKAVELFDTVWCDELRQLSDKHGGVAINSKELRAGYDPHSPAHYNEVLKKLQERFVFKSPK